METGILKETTMHSLIHVLMIIFKIFRVIRKRKVSIKSFAVCLTSLQLILDYPAKNPNNLIDLITSDIINFPNPRIIFINFSFDVVYEDKLSVKVQRTKINDTWINTFKLDNKVLDFKINNDNYDSFCLKGRFLLELTVKVFESLIHSARKLIQRID